MPHVSVKMHPGPSEEAKQALTRAIVKDVMTHAQVSEDSVSVSIEEVGPGRWTADVYKPDIEAKQASLYKKPGYKPL
jgi:4-oxalocrotonate tautomerase